MGRISRVIATIGVWSPNPQDYDPKCTRCNHLQALKEARARKFSAPVGSQTTFKLT